MASKQKILIVDDDNNIAELISLYLTKECYDTKIVNDGEEAVREFHSFQPNLILLDLMLPGMDGYQVCREIRHEPMQSPSGRTCPAMAMQETPFRISSIFFIFLILFVFFVCYFINQFRHRNAIFNRLIQDKGQLRCIAEVNGLGQHTADEALRAL